MTVGAIIFVGVMKMLNWDFKRLSTVKYETNTYEINESFKNITINTEAADIIFKKSTDSRVLVVCCDTEHTNYSIAVRDSTLTVEYDNTGKWYHHIGIGFGTSSITVYLPEGSYGDLKIKESTGDVTVPHILSFESIDVHVSTGDVKCEASADGLVKLRTTTGAITCEGISAGSLELTASTGKISLSHITCKDSVYASLSTGKMQAVNLTCEGFSSTGSTGDITLEGVISEKGLSIERSTGDVLLSGCDAETVSVTTDTGDITGTLLTPKIFTAKTDTGKVSVPKSLQGGDCTLTTDTGNISIDILEE